MSLTKTTIDLPGGPFTAIDDDGTVIAAGFADVPGAHDASPASPRSPIARALAAYARGDVHAIDDVPVRQDGSPFMAEVWHAMRSVGAGETVSYAELAARAGRPRAVRAAGTACAANAVPLFVPCHRVIRSDGSLGNYAYGLPVKEALLRHERIVRA